MRYLKKFESYEPSEIEEMIEYIKDIYSEISEEFDVRVVPQNIHHKHFNYIDVSISKKPSIPYKIDETGEEIEDWINYKPSLFKPSEIINTLLSSKSYIESIGGKISKIWIHSNLNTGLDMSIDDLLNPKWIDTTVRQIGIKYSI
jgi:hypothetical protein